MEEKSTNKKTRWKLAVMIAVIILLAIGGIWVWWACSSRTSSLRNARYIGEVPTPFAYQRIEAQDKSYAAYLRSLPLKPQGCKVQLYTGGDANYQWLSAAVVDMKLLSNYEQCADVTMRIRAEYLYKMGRFKDICFTDVNGQKMQYQGGKDRNAFESYLKRVYGMCNTASLYKETTPRLVREVQPGDVLVYPARNGHQYGHAMLVVDVAHTKSGKVAVLCVEGNTPAREMHLLRNVAHPFRNPWFILDDDSSAIHISVFNFAPEELRHY